MEVPQGHDRKLTVCMYEFFGTMGLLFAINVGGGDAAAICVTLFALLLICASVSGSHFNPAVTLAVYFAEKDLGKNLCFMLMIMAS